MEITKEPGGSVFSSDSKLRKKDKTSAASLAPSGIQNPKAPHIFAFTNYREFLLHFYQFKKQLNSSYSMSVFARRAGLGANSRGYLKMIIDGKRNLTPHTIRRFADALELGVQETMYFENLVFYNQSKTLKDQEHFFQRLTLAAQGKESEKLRLLRHQFNYYTKWYFVAVRELVGLNHFKEDPKWIAANLRGKVTEAEAAAALKALTELGLIERSPNGALKQKTPLVGWNHKFFSEIVTRFQLEMIERAKETIQSDPFGERDASSVTLSCSKKMLPLIIEKVDAFRDQLVREFGVDTPLADAVIQINFQSFQLTPQNGLTERKDKGSRT